MEGLGGVKLGSYPRLHLKEEQAWTPLLLLTYRLQFTCMYVIMTTIETEGEEGKKGIDDHKSEPTEEGSRKPMPADAVRSGCQS